MPPATPAIETARQTTDRSILLAHDPEQWVPSARQAYRDVLAELESWCRKHQAPQGLNTWVAEEAIRRAW
jgi:hypothetical protein